MALKISTLMSPFQNSTASYHQRWIFSSEHFCPFEKSRTQKMDDPLEWADHLCSQNTFFVSVRNP